MTQQHILERVSLNIQDGIATVTLNRPEKHNAIDWPMFKALDKTAGILKRSRQVRVVIIEGAGEDFCSGLDIKSVLANPIAAAKLLFKWWPTRPNLAQRVSSNWRKLSVPVIVAIHGRCWGGGLQVALGGDFRIATPDASLSIMENKWGLIPDMGGTLALREIMRVDQAMYLAMTAKELNGIEALNKNLLFEVHENPMHRATELANEIINRSPDSIAAIKKLYHKAWHKNDGAILAGETLYQLGVIKGKNQRIAVSRAKGDSDKSFIHR
ncbi:MAG: crotonase/enoyl-CoA hydratase family protein [Aestuariibacter sp.]